MEGRLHITAASKTDAGLVRERNEDAVLFYQPADLRAIEEKGVLAIVADGVGGNSAGEIASKLAVETVQEAYFHNADHKSVSDALEEAIKVANRRIINIAEKESAYKGMATTCTALVLRHRDLVIAHVGDTRAYRFRNGKLEQLTRDHTLVNELLEEGLISETDAKNHPQGNVIVRALGSQRDIEVDVVKLIAEADECYLLCSDGLSNLVSEQEMAQILSSCTPEGSCGTMVDVARQRGGHDNITVQVIKLSANGPESPRKTRLVANILPHMEIRRSELPVLVLSLLGMIIFALVLSVYFADYRRIFFGFV